jgi:hypothetical protein
MSPGAALLLAAAIGVAIWLWWRQGGRASGAEAQLRGICLGNAGQVERLIAGEMTRAPGISRAEAARRAVERYRRDNR